MENRQISKMSTFKKKLMITAPYSSSLTYNVVRRQQRQFVCILLVLLQLSSVRSFLLPNRDNFRIFGDLDKLSVNSYIHNERSMLSNNDKAFSNRQQRPVHSRRHFRKSSLFMFTGIVEEMGRVVSMNLNDNMTLWDGSKSSGYELVLESNDGVVMNDIYLGCSISVCGVCLTVTEYDVATKQFRVGLADETLQKTYFRQLQHNDPLNLERACILGGRNSGHAVQGHVDCTGTILSREFISDSLKICIKVNEPSMIQFIVPKGFIAIDGTSLTVIDVNYVDCTFTFMLIEYTQKHIIVPKKLINDLVNIEVDVMAKYAAAAATATTIQTTDSTMESGIIPSHDVLAILERLNELEKKVAFLEEKLSSSL